MAAGRRIVGRIALTGMMIPPVAGEARVRHLTRRGAAALAESMDLIEEALEMVGLSEEALPRGQPVLPPKIGEHKEIWQRLADEVKRQADAAGAETIARGSLTGAADAFADFRAAGKPEEAAPSLQRIAEIVSGLFTCSFRLRDNAWMDRCLNHPGFCVARQF